MAYTLTANENVIVRNEDGAQSFIPTDPDNLDYQEFIRFVEEGGTPNPYVPPPAAKREKAGG